MSNVERLEQKMNQASLQIKKCLRPKTGGTAAEKLYQDAYTELARVGARQKLRGKYRDPIHRV